MIADMKVKSIFTTNSGPILSAQLRNRGKSSPKSQNEVKDNTHTQELSNGHTSLPGKEGVGGRTLEYLHTPSSACAKWE